MRKCYTSRELRQARYQTIHQNEQTVKSAEREICALLARTAGRRQDYTYRAKYEAGIRAPAVARRTKVLRRTRDYVLPYGA